MTDIPQRTPASRSPWKTIMVTLAALLVSWYVFPAPVAGWVKDHCDDEGPFCAALQTVANGVDTASRGVGVAGVFETLRDDTKTALGIENY
jgi:hypothetical protein